MLLDATPSPSHRCTNHPLTHIISCTVASTVHAYDVTVGHVTRNATLTSLLPALKHFMLKSQSVMSGDLGGHNNSGWSFPDARLIQRPGNTVFRYGQTSQWKWAGLASCWNVNVGRCSNCVISHTCNMSRYVMPVTVSSAIPEYIMKRPV
jgi:hypothetical protein